MARFSTSTEILSLSAATSRTSCSFSAQRSAASSDCEKTTSFTGSRSSVKAWRTSLSFCGVRNGMARLYRWAHAGADQRRHAAFERALESLPERLLVARRGHRQPGAAGRALGGDGKRCGAQDHDHDRQRPGGGGPELGRPLGETGRSREADDATLAVRELGGDGRREREARRGQPIGGEELVRGVDVPGGGHGEHLLAGVDGGDRSARRRLADDLGDAYGGKA